MIGQRYEASALTTLVTASANSPLWALKGVTRPLWVREIHAWAVTAPTTSLHLGLVRSTALGTGTLTSVTGQPIQALQDSTSGAPVATGIIVTNWATAAPTLTSPVYFRRFAGAAVIGTGFIWTFEPPGLYVPGNAQATSELVIANIVGTAPGTFAATFVWAE
jgi:hypothetical protein